MARLSAPKVVITTEMKERQLRLRKFLQMNKCIEFKELRPIGFSINVSTIPDDLVEEFLSITNENKKIKSVE